MKQLNGKRILILQQRGWGINIGHFLAKKFQAEGCRLAAVSFKKTTHEYIIANQAEVKYDLLINNDEIIDQPKNYLAGDDYPLEEICRELGVDTVWPIVSTLRNHVRSYKDKYYYSYRQNVPDDEIILYIKACYKLIKYIFEKFNPEVIIAPNFVSLPQIMINLYAAKKGVKMLGITDSKIKGIFLFGYDFNYSQGHFFERVDALNGGSAVSENTEKACRYIEEFRENFKIPDYMENEAPKKINIKQKIRHNLAPFYHIMQWYANKPKNALESTGVTIDNRPPRIILRDHYGRDKYVKYMENYRYFPFEKLKKYVYFPLQVQPEESIDVTAPYFSNQIETSRLLAISLPDDYTLAVKEHPGMIGYRSPSYIEKIDRTVNVKLIDYRISSKEALEKSDLVISPNSTTLAEAAFLWKPAIQLGNLGLTMKLPNVFKHTDMTTIARKIKELLRINLKTAEYEKELVNFVAAAYDTGYDFDYFMTWEKGGQDNLEPLWQIYKKEILSVLP